jgi:6-phosphogluconate dehydrogenase
MASLALIGLGAMGRNLAWNLLGQGIPLAVYSYDAAELEHFRLSLAPPPRSAASLSELVGGLARPRTVFLMVTAGAAVDSVIGDLVPLLDVGDLVIDGGNSHFEDTRRRAADLQARGIGYLGVGISGGEAGARHGASLMVGGRPADYERERSLFRALAAQCGSTQRGDVLCETWVGPDGAGHFVKMVHNGIEYGLMQLLAEAWRFMAEGLGLSRDAQRRVFETWSGGALASYLVDITAAILGVEDAPGIDFLDVVADRAAQKGTGRWTIEAALRLGVPVPTISAAVTERLVSALPDRGGAAMRAKVPDSGDDWIPALERALLASFLATFDQGFRLLAAASDEYAWQFDLPAIARVWQGGCIIRAALLADMEQVVGAGSLLAAPGFAATLQAADSDWRRIVGACAQAGMTAPALSSALAYHDSLRAARLPTNLIQAQRDWFGGHGFERVDRPGRFHGPWQRP